MFHGSEGMSYDVGHHILKQIPIPAEIFLVREVASKASYRTILYGLKFEESAQLE